MPDNLPETAFLILSFLLPILVLPILMRFLIGRIILFFVKKLYLPSWLHSAREGWFTERDREAMDGVIEFAGKRMRYHFVFSYHLVNDLRAILLIVQNAYRGKRKDPGKLVLSFSLNRLLECLLLAFTDLYREYSSQPWFRIIRSTRLEWFRRIHGVIWITSFFASNRVIERFRTTRIGSSFLRFILIPILGIPSFIWYILKALGVNILFEGFFRFFYGTLLLKAGYYAMFLYGRKNDRINRKIREFPKKRLDDLALRIESLLDPAEWDGKSSDFDEAAALYNDLLVGFGLSEDEKFLSRRPRRSETMKRFLNRFAAISREALAGQFLSDRKTVNDRDQLLYACREIGKIYYPKAAEPIFTFRLHELLEMGWMASIIILQKVLSIPGSRSMLETVTVETILQVKGLAELDMVKFISERFGNSFRYIRTYRSVRRIMKTLKGTASPFGLLWDLGSPILVRQLQDVLRQFVYTRAGRILIYGFETTVLHTGKDLTLLFGERAPSGRIRKKGEL